MASIVLGGVGAALGAAAGLSTVGKIGGTIIGSFIDQTIWSKNNNISTEGQRLKDLSVQGCNYGTVIPIIYGTVKIAGNIIWASPIKEQFNKTVTTHGSKYNKVTQNHLTYTYTVSLAISVCEGPITAIQQIWADDILIDFNQHNIKIYLGNESQMPDPCIENIQGIGRTPAYRGLAYIVLNDLNLSSYNNKIPNFTFEVKRLILSHDSAENAVTSIVMIPGSGEFVYDTIVQNKVKGEAILNSIVPRGLSENINCHNNLGKANSLLSLDNLKITLPNIEWVAPVVAWYVNKLNIENCSVLPGVEFKEYSYTYPSQWQVANYTRKTAYQISIDQKNNTTRYGGTVNDQSIIRYLVELKSRGYKILFYPLLFVDLPTKPWRGRMHGSVEEVKNFFHKKEGYNNFILHYAKLVRDYVDGFIIGSEMIGLTSIKDLNNNFVTVDELINLANEVRKILGDKVKISYAADWSEYHHTQEGWYNLDKLWSCQNIDFIGIDAYFPLTDFKTCNYDNEAIERGWSSDGSIKTEYDIKDIEWWWNNYHVNPNNKKTSWKPKSKKIWFTEYGFPSVKLSTNQPNVFYDPKSSESAFPKHSNGEVDILAQRIAIEATEKKWKNSLFIENKFLWCWDARPYPLWPNRSDIWSDGINDIWIKGHWVQGKLGVLTLSALLSELSIKAGLNPKDIKLSNIVEIIDGIIINQPCTIRSIIEYLQQSYFFDTIEYSDTICFINRKNKNLSHIQYEDLLSSNSQTPLSVKILQEYDLPCRVDVNFINSKMKYIVCNQHAKRMYTNSKNAAVLYLPIILDNFQANYIAESILYNTWVERYQYSFLLPIKYIYLKVSDIVCIEYDEQKTQIRILSIELGRNYQLKVAGVADDISNDYSLKFNIYDNNKQALRVIENEYGTAKTIVEILDITKLPYEEVNSSGRALVAVCADNSNWRGCELFAKLNNAKREFITFIDFQSIIGSLLFTTNYTANNALIDKENILVVNIINFQLFNIDFEEMINGKNTAVLGNEIIQFQQATLVNSHQYKLSKLLRGLYGSTIQQHSIGTRFVLVTPELLSINLSTPMDGYIDTISIGKIQKLQNDAIALTYQNNYTKPLPITHLQYNNDVITWHAQSFKALKELLFKIEFFNFSTLIFAKYLKQDYNISQVFSYSLAQLKLDGQLFDFNIIKIREVEGNIEGQSSSIFIENNFNKKIHRFID